VTYTPAAGYTGPDSFSYAASDGTLSSLPATVTLSIQPPGTPTTTNPQPDPPAASAPTSTRVSTLVPAVLRLPIASIRVLNSGPAGRRGLRVRITCSELCTWQIRVRWLNTRSPTRHPPVAGHLNTRLSTTHSKTITVPVHTAHLRAGRRARLAIEAAVLFPRASYTTLIERTVIYRRTT
jgi:hypothetical protein